ncbi:MAG: hypothetical protein AB7E36_00670 [Salinivirgaceae bacterium]
MKKMNVKLWSLLLSAFMLVFVTACENSDDPEPAIDYTPVLGSTFNFVVDGNDVTFTTTIPGNVWFTVDGTDYPTVDKAVTVNLPLKGTYAATCSSLGSGTTLTSAPFDVVIEQDDLSYLERGAWKALTGGAEGNKTWVLDVREVVTTTIDNAGVETSSSVFKSVYFHNALDFYGEEGVGGNEDGAWGPWGGTNIYGWGGTPEAGEITFNGVNRTATLTIDGEPTTASFAMNVYDRDPNYLIIPKENAGGTDMSLWDYMLEKTGYGSLVSLSDEMGDISFSGELRFPMDIGRLTNDGNATIPSQFLEEDLKNVTILHASDSGLIMRVKRTYEGDNENKCWLLYNYIVKGYDYGVKTPLTHPVRTDITAETLAGTWKVAVVPIDWVSWATKDVMNAWADTTAIPDWAKGGALGLTNAYEIRLNFNTDGTCTINGVVTTYTISKGGYIAFADDVNIPVCAVTLAGKNIYAVDVASSTEGIWLGQNDDEGKEETPVIHLVKE